MMRRMLWGMSVKLSILIAYRDRYKNLQVLLNQIKRNLIGINSEIEVIIIDLGSRTDLTQELSKYKFVKYIYVNYFETYSKSWALNIAFKKSQFDWLFLLDVDCLFLEGFLKFFLSYLNPSDINTFYSFTVKSLNEEITKLILEKRYISKDIKKILSVYYDKIYTLIGVGNIIIHRDMFLKLKGYDENFIGWGREDSDFYNRILTAGYKENKISSNPEFSLYHLFHSRDTVSYCNSLILVQNDFIEKNNKLNKIYKVNNDSDWGEIDNEPSQYNYENIIKFEIEYNINNLPLLKVNNIYFNNLMNPLNFKDEFLYMENIDFSYPIIILGGGLNYAYKEIIKNSSQVIIIEKYRRIKKESIKLNFTRTDSYLNIDYKYLLAGLQYIKTLKNKNIILHKSSFEFDKKWYDQIFQFISTVESE